MKQNILYVGLDVDDTQYHGSAFNQDTGEAVCGELLICRMNSYDFQVLQWPD